MRAFCIHGHNGSFPPHATRVQWCPRSQRSGAYDERKKAQAWTLPFVPPIAAAVVATLLSWRRAAPLAYISGSLRTLIGADLLNLGRIQGLGTPIASIGGAGTFDGIFLTGILAVLLTGTPFPEGDNDHD